ncbi:MULTISPECIES: hypothetical protein [unclassified Streptomyces]|uniref:hypothetical protein n=1 Tax=unclassified Streptomyces TaxID=2593676 RepID=UPI002E803C68|nr:hypothetical protein [Streptomyces sp. NBC_00562]WTF25422.1 hypothetical protein OG955_03640 [Streptomyces sp. NBC_01602]WUC24751.1 hypothetical protein OHA33_41715 [Streptomyces sp. NBC_00562]
MALISIDRERGLLTAEIQGLDKLWSLKSRLEIPLAHVRGATHDPGITRERKGVGGTNLPGVITAGRFLHNGERLFWDVKNPDKAVVIELADAESYDRLVIEVDDPRATVALIEQSIARG